jgi:hypothetical protein
VDSEWINEMYFMNRTDGLKLSPSRLSVLATAWV